MNSIFQAQGIIRHPPTLPPTPPHPLPPSTGWVGWELEGGGRKGGELYPGPEILNYNPFSLSSLSRLVYVLRHWANYFWIFDLGGFSGHTPFWKSVYLCVL